MSRSSHFSTSTIPSTIVLKNTSTVDRCPHQKKNWKGTAGEEFQNLQAEQGTRPKQTTWQIGQEVSLKETMIIKQVSWKSPLKSTLELKDNTAFVG